MIRYRMLFLLICMILVSGCSLKKSENQAPEVIVEEVKLDYAREFSLKRQSDRTLLKVYIDEHHSEQTSREFILVKDSVEAASDPNAIQVPCKKIVCVTST